MEKIAEKEWIGKKIEGAWKLEKWIYIDENGEETRFFGQKPEGLLIYHNSGYMSVQVAQENRGNFKSNAIDGGSKEEAHNAFNTFLSYYGKFVEESPGKFVHTVEGTLFPNWLGHEEVRYADIKGSTLVLSTPPIETGSGKITFKITWKKYA